MKESLVTYIRIREIFQPYLRYAYGDYPIELPETTELYDIFSTGLLSNYAMKKVCYSTFSQAAYQAGVENRQPVFFSEEQDKWFVPRTEDKSKLVPFVMPHSVIIGGRRKNTDKWFQLGNKGYKIFRDRIERDFWNELENFDRKVRLFCDRKNLKYSIELSVEKFMIKTGMDMDDFDSLCRYWREERARGDSAISKFTNKESTVSLQDQLDFELVAEAEKLESVYNR